jgi:hypothetical protein
VRGMDGKTIVVYDLFNENRRTHAALAVIVPLRSVNYKLISPHHWGEVEVEDPVEIIRLTYPKKVFTRYSLYLQGLRDEDYIIPVTVHGEWKQRKHQGIVFAVSTWVEPTDYYIKPTRSYMAFNVIRSTLLKHL